MTISGYQGTDTSYSSASKYSISNYKKTTTNNQPSSSKPKTTFEPPVPKNDETQPPPNPHRLEGKEEWAIPSNIATPGQWETVVSSSKKKPKEEKEIEKKTTTHDNAPEFQDDDEEEEDLRNFKIQEKQLPTQDLEDDDNNKEGPLFKKHLEGWILVFVSSIACILGASVVFIDKCNFWSSGRHQHSVSILENQSFLAASMALASGVLLFSSLAVLLPASRQRLGASGSYLVYLCFFGGAFFTLGLTKIIHALTPDAIHACGGPPSSPCDMEHDSATTSDEEVEQDDLHHHHHHDPAEDEESTMAGANEQAHPYSEDENQPIFIKSHSHHHLEHHYGSTPHHHHQPHLFREAHFRFHHHHHHHPEQNENNEYDHDQHHHQHHHGDQEEYQHFLRIGIQTAVAIGVHKFPEGLIMFISNRASEKLGWAIAAAMSIHNLTEGFMIALPLYLALKSRSAAFGWAALLGGLSQPIGAVLGLLLMRNIDSSKEDLMFGIIFAISMLPQAIKADTRHRYVLPFFFLGIFFVGLTAILKSL
ncbi:ZIP zinc transporter-domain-containing protein [Phascolomyces articulosus]|uniref:ZIP zinc transporter-domain-containing protein n=1 Tax=Phascolomyces articulosus TaxID=60185 RepID=A0AAD5JZC4_9FUNG|nr:ZIP zinc transporter-domain-containing protein [Phascolomyces articulosus]